MAIDIDSAWLALARMVYGSSGQGSTWRASAACAGAGHELFFSQRTGRARQMCAMCPVREICGHDQMAWERRSSASRQYPAGVFGGLSSGQRRAIYLAEKHDEGNDGER